MPSITSYAKRKCFYCDKTSQERGTGVIKTKYKLAGIQASDSFRKLGIKSFVYFVCTSQVNHSVSITLKIEPTDLVHYVHKPMSHVPTYVDLRRRERIFEGDLRVKVADSSNGFTKVAMLSDSKWTELQTLAPAVLSQRVDDKVKQDVLYSLLDRPVAEDLLRNWGILGV